MSYNLHLMPVAMDHHARVMIFVDGENLAIRYGSMISNGEPQESHVFYQPNVFVWSQFAHVRHYKKYEHIRSFYYTSVQGDSPKIDTVERELKRAGFEAPRVFQKSKGKPSKRVDISLATDMLTHAFRKNFDFAILVAGDEDYVPLVEAVMGGGLRVVLWFVKDGLSPALVKQVDHFFDLGGILFQPAGTLERHLFKYTFPGPP